MIEELFAVVRSPFVMKYSRRKKDRAELDEPQLDISSLIDVCFLMLIFFLVTTTIGRRSRSG